jgi:hypothetical protein
MGTIIILDLFSGWMYASLNVKYFVIGMRYVKAISTRGFVWMC